MYISSSSQGKTLFDSSTKALETIRLGVNKIYQEEIEGELTITSTQAFTSLMLMPRLHKFAKLHPSIKIRFLPSAKFEDFRDSNVDLAIRFGTQVEQTTPHNLICEYFGESGVYPICSAKLAKKHNINCPDDLLDNWLVALEHPGPYDWSTWFDSLGVKGFNKHQKLTKVNSTDVALSAVCNHHGVTLAVPYLCKTELESGQLIIPFKYAHPEKVKCYLVYDKHSSRITRISKFTQWLKSEMSDI